jgi:hypothetical protein
MNDCQDCQQRYCCIINGEGFCNNHCSRINCYCIRCKIRRSVRDTEQEQCRFSDNDACCYISVRTGQFQGHQSYRITRICQAHCPTSDCECYTCQENHEVSRYELDVLTIPINHPYITVRDGYPKAQAYIFERELSPETVQG